MCELRDWISKGLVEQNLLGCVVYMVVATDYMRYLLRCVVYDDAEVVGSRAVAPEYNEVFYLLVLDADRAFDQVFEGCLALGHFKSYRIGLIRAIGYGLAALVITRRATCLKCCFASFLQFVRRTPAAIGKAFFY